MSNFECNNNNQANFFFVINRSINSGWWCCFLNYITSIEFLLWKRVRSPFKSFKCFKPQERWLRVVFPSSFILCYTEVSFLLPKSFWLIYLLKYWNEYFDNYHKSLSRARTTSSRSSRFGKRVLFNSWWILSSILCKL